MKQYFVEVNVVGNTSTQWYETHEDMLKEFFKNVEWYTTTYYRPGRIDFNYTDEPMMNILPYYALVDNGHIAISTGQGI
jgi:hypothetical protein